MLLCKDNNKFKNESSKNNEQWKNYTMRQRKNEAKIKFMRAGNQDTAGNKFLITQNTKFKAKDVFKYLWLLIGKIEKERVVDRISKRNQCVEINRSILRSNKLSKKKHIKP